MHPLFHGVNYFDREISLLRIPGILYIDDPSGAMFIRNPFIRNRTPERSCLPHFLTGFTLEGVREVALLAQERAKKSLSRRAKQPYHKIWRCSTTMRAAFVAVRRQDGLLAHPLTLDYALSRIADAFEFTRVGPLDVDFRLPGVNNVYNAVAATSAPVTLGIAAANIRKGLERARPLQGRGETVTYELIRLRLFVDSLIH